MTDDHPIACRLTQPAKARRLANLRENLFASVMRARETDDGFAFSFSNSAAVVDQLQHLVAFERACCPFLTFELRFPPEPQPIILQLSGNTEIKAFVRDTFLALVPARIA
jgi:hypothetical protein